MSEQSWREKMASGRSAASSTAAALSSSAREAAAAARARIGDTYGTARDRAASLASDSRELAHKGSEAGRAIGAQAASTSRKVVDRAMVESRGLIAERPLTAIAVGVTAGIVLGLLANHLAGTRKAQADDDDEIDYEA